MNLVPAEAERNTKSVAEEMFDCVLSETKRSFMENK
jgi:hypothetical protein